MITIHHIEKLFKGVDSTAPLTLLDYILDPVLTPVFMRREGYKSVKTDKKYYGEFLPVLKKTAPYKQIPFGRLHTVLDGSLSNEAAFYIYSLIRSTKPSVVVETGISSGFSTAIILAAMNSNNHGELWSTDIHEEVGCMTYWVDKRRWHKCIGKPDRILEDTLTKIKGPLDIFLHDSDHSYKAMSYEFDLSSRRVRHGGFILSDDIDENSAFKEVCEKHHLQPSAVYSPSKLFGVMRLP